MEGSHFKAPTSEYFMKYYMKTFRDIGFLHFMIENIGAVIERQQEWTQMPDNMTNLSSAKYFSY